MNTEYIIVNGELYHYGVPGMKWGHRRAQKREERINRRISKIENTRKLNAATNEYNNTNSKLNYSKPKQAKKLNRALADNKAAYDTTEVDNKYAIARQKAKLDKNYKQSAEFKQAKQAFRKQTTQRLIYGELGHQKIESLKNQGNSERKAKAKVICSQILAGIGAVAVSTAIGYAMNRN